MIINQIKNLSRDSLYYGAGTALRRFFSVFTAPIMTRIFTPDDYGVMGLITSTIAFASLILTFGINGGIFIHYYEVSEKEKKVLLFSGISSFTIILTASVIVGIISAEQISILLFKSNRFSNVLRIALIQIPIVQLFEHFTTLLRYQKKVKQFVIISGLQLSLNLLFLLFFVAYLKLGLVGVYLNAITANGIPLVIIIIMLRKYYTLKFDYNYVKDCLAFSIPLMPGWFLNMYLMKASIYFLQAYHTTTEVGLFSIASRVAGIVNMMLSIFFLAWDPLSYKLIPRENKHFMYDVVSRIFTFMASSIILIITLFSKEVLIILAPPEYYSAFNVVGFIALGAMIMYLNGFFSMGIIISKNTVYKSISIAFGAISSTLICILFIPAYPLLAASTAPLVGYLVVSIIISIISQGQFKIPFKFFRLAATIIYVISIVTLYYIFSPMEYYLSFSVIMLKILIAIISILILLVLSFDRIELSKLKSKIFRKY
jgi:O-antigen/teichoic acid export membrane protein